MYRIALFLFIINVVYVKCAPLTPTQKNITMYDQILANCSSAASLKDNSLLKVLKPCEDWSKIQKTTALNATTEQSVKCLLFYTTFMNFCKKTENKIEASAFKPETIERPVKLETICDQLANISSSQLNITLGTGCLRLCASYYENGVDRMCLQAYHYTNLTQNTQISKIAPKPAPAIQVVSNQKSDKPEAEPRNEPKTPPKAEKIEKTSVVHNTAELEPQKDEKNEKTNPTTTEAVLQPKEEQHPLVPAGRPQIQEPVAPEPAVPEPKHVENNIKGIEPNIVDEQNSEPQENPPNLPPDNMDNEEANEDDDEIDKNYNEHEKKPAEESAIAPQPPQEEVELDHRNEPVHMRIDDINNGDSSFFSYFMVVSVLCVAFYVGYHNRQKIMALLLEGKRRRPYRGRRPNSANYHKLDSNLEEAISSSCSKSATNVIY